MNEKLKKYKYEGLFTERVQQSPAHNRIPVDARVFLSVSRATRTEKRPVLRVSFHENILKSTGWMPKDIINIKITGEEVVMFRSDVGRTLSNGSSKHDRAHVRYAYPVKWLDSFPVGVCREVEAEPGKIAFLLPMRKTD